MQLSRALRLSPSQPAPNPQSGGSIAFVGAGGKTTAIFLLARELQSQIENRKLVLSEACPERRRRVETSAIIVTAASHLGAWQIPLADHHIVAESPEEIGELPEGITLVTGPIEADRTQPVNFSVLSWLHEVSKNKNLPFLIEADGSRARPLKAPAAREPPIPDFVETVIVVAGLGGLGQPLDEDHVHRPHLFSTLSGLALNQPVTPASLVRLLTHPAGGLKNIPARARRVALLNQAETPELQSIGGGIARGLLGHFDSVLVGSLQQNDFHTFERTAGILLAAGESKRFGQPKQLLDWKGKPFVRQVAETALHAGLWPVIVVTGSNAEQVEKAVTGLDVTIVRNENWQNGQGASIATGVRALPKNTGASIFLLADQPQIPAEILRALVETHAQNLPAILAPLALEEKRANPVLFDRIAFPDLLQLAGDVGGRALFGKYKVEYLPWHDEALLLDVDTPEDYERLKKLISLS